jgi:hypothetical protein
MQLVVIKRSGIGMMSMLALRQPDIPRGCSKDLFSMNKGLCNSASVIFLLES